MLERSGATEGTALGLLPGGGFVLLETTTTPELELEGHARDLIRDVQQARRAAGLEVTDRIDLAVEGDADLLAMLERHGDLVRGETLVESLDRRAPRAPARTTASSAGRTGTSCTSRPAPGEPPRAAAFELRRAGGSVLDV